MTQPSPFDVNDADIFVLDERDLEAPLLTESPCAEEREADAAAAAPPPPRAAAWPALRGSSVSTRKLSPQRGFPQAALDHDAGSPTGSATWHPPPPAATYQRPVGLPVAMPAASPGPAADSADGTPERAPLGAKAAGRHRHARAAIVGGVNAIIQLPVVVSFASIIFRDGFFAPRLSPLIKLVFLSSAIHQAVFSLGSSMPYAVGQVQDVGLIFLSAMASAVVERCGAAGVGAADTLGTVLAALALSTAAVGLLVVLTGRLRMASAVQYCPLPVVGGYLAYVGYFCLVAGVSLASGAPISSPSSWRHLTDPGVLLHLLPGLATVALLSLVLRRFRSPYALPALLVAVPAAFYAALYTFGWTLDDARAGGWVVQPQPGDREWRFWRLYELYNVHTFPPTNLHWAALPPQLGMLLALYFVVAFGSSMDIAAIQTDSPADLDYNSELVVVGLSNLAVGAAGVAGGTGSYIFSQTLFSLRMGVDSPAMGVVIVAAELAAFALPLNIMAYLPNFYFGALVMWIGADILKDWLFISAKKVAAAEYALLVGTFAAVLALGLEGGIAAGVVAAALHFTYQYAQVSVKAFTVVPSRSGSVRSFDQRTVLEAYTGRVAAVSLSGMVFFGSAQKMADQVLAVAASVLQTQPHAPAAGLGADEGSAAAREEESAPPTGLPSVPSERTLSATYDQFDVLKASSGLAQAAAALQEAPLVMLLDLSRVQGIDATAARTFVTLHTKLRRRGVRLALTGLRPGDAGDRMRRLLVGQGLILGEPTGVATGAASAQQADYARACAWFPTMDAGLAWCEEQYLEVAVRRGLCRPRPERVTLAEVLRSNLEMPRLILGPAPVDYAAAAGRLGRFCARRALAAGEALFDVGEPADEVYIVECGCVAVHIDFLATTVHGRSAAAATPSRMAASRPARTLRFGPGGIVGDLDFMLQRPRSYAAVCEHPGGAWVLTRPAFERLARAAPEVLVLLQTVILRLNCLSATHALEALERSAL